jgi:hypothetical protein
MDTSQGTITQPGQDGAVRPALDQAAASAARVTLERRVYLHHALAAAAALDAAEQLGVLTRLAAGHAGCPGARLRPG